jgi:anti-sigma regulatory factor (Ser/Thr protein kinase)
MERVIINLLANAVKFSKHNGTIHIKSSQKGNFILFSIQDTGPGIAKKYLKDIFKKFHMGDRSSITGKGHGLGLTITKSFVEMHGGKIFVKSQRHKGSTFVIYLRVEKRLEPVRASIEKKVVILDLAGDLQGTKNRIKCGNMKIQYFKTEKEWARRLSDINCACLIINERYEFRTLNREVVSFLLNKKMKHIPCCIIFPVELSQEERDLYNHLNIHFLNKPITIDRLEHEINAAIKMDRRKK